MKSSTTSIKVPGEDVLFDPEAIEERRRDSPHREINVGGEPYCGVCGKLADADTKSRKVFRYHGDLFQDQAIEAKLFYNVDGKQEELGALLFMPWATDQQMRSLLLDKFWEPCLDAVGASAVFVINRER